ncbi:MAG: M20/M25/M40 family metallo-hydrolase [Sulfolobales archaeon]
MSTFSYKGIRDKAFSLVDKNISNYISLLKDLVSYKSVASWGLGGVKECAKYLSDVLRERGFKVFMYSSGGSPAILGEIGSGSKTVLIYNHYDIQPPDPLELWNSNPFELSIKDNLLIGRGVADNKGNIVARIAAVDSLLDYLDKLDIRIKFLIDGEEEIGSPTLADIVKDNLSWMRADGGIWETSYLGSNDRLEIPLGFKGILYLEIILKEAVRDAHSGLAPLVPNPVWKIAKLLTHLKNEEGKVLVPGFYDDIDAEFISSAEELIKQIDPRDLDLIRDELGLEKFVGDLKGVDALRKLYINPSLNVSGLYSGFTDKGVKTIVPALAGVKIDIRPVPGQKPEKILEAFNRYLKELGYSDVEVIVHSMYPAGYTKPYEEIVKASITAALEVYGKHPKVLPISSGSGPIYLFTNIAVIPMTGAGVGYINSKVHAPNENIRKDDFIKGIKHVALTLINFSVKPR